MLAYLDNVCYVLSNVELLNYYYMILKIFLIVISVVAYIGLNYWSLLITIKFHSRQTKADEDLGMFLAVIAALCGAPIAFINQTWAIWLGAFMLLGLFILWDKKRRELDRLAKDEDRDIKAGLRAFNMFNFNEKLYKRCVFWGLGIWLPVNLATALIIYLL